VPTLKGGSTIGIPSPPAIWRPEEEQDYRIVTPGIRSAEALQGFPKNWTKPAEAMPRGDRHRWRLVGNAVPVGVGEWVGRNLANPAPWAPAGESKLDQGRPWPPAAWGDKSGAYPVDRTIWPEKHRYRHLLDLVRKDVTPLSLRASRGFLDRLERGRLTVPAQFRIDLKEHVDRMS